MKNKKFSRARAMALTLSLSALPISAFALTNVNVPIAYADMTGSSDTNFGNLNYTQPNFLTVNSARFTGVRIYLAKRNDFKSNSGRFNNSALDDYRRFALYEFYLNETEEGHTTATKLNDLLFNFKAYSLGKTGFYDISEKQIVATSTTSDGEGLGFKNLITDATPEVMGYQPWEYSTSYATNYSGGRVNSLGSLSDWCNGTFKEGFNMDTFLSKYNTYLDNAGLLESAKKFKFPEDSTGYNDAGWTVIIEPVMVCLGGANLSSNTPLYTFSYQDYFCPEQLDSVSFNASDLHAGANSVIGAADDFENGMLIHGAGGDGCGGTDSGSNQHSPTPSGHTCVSDGISKYMFELRNFYSVSDGYKFGNPTNGGQVDKGGIGIYGDDDAFRSNIEANLNRNITLISDQLKPSGAAIRADRNTGDNPYFANTADGMSQAGDKLDNIVVVQGGASQQDLWVYNSNLKGASKNADGLVTTLADISSRNMWNAHQNELNNLKFLNKGSDGSKPLMTADTLSNANRLRILKEFSGLNLDGYSNVDTASDNVTLANLHMVETVSATYNSGSEGGLNINDVAHQMDLSQYRVTPTLTPLGSSESVLSFGSMIGGRLERVSSDVTSTVDGVSSNADAVDSAGLEIINKAMSGVQGTETADKNTANAHFVVPPSDTVDIISPKDVENIIGSEVVANINDPTVGAILSKTNGTLKKGKIYGYADGEGKKSGTGLGLGITLQTYIPKNEVSSYVTYIHRDENGDISISRDTTEYTYDATSSGVVPFDKAKFGGSNAVYAIAIPNTANNESSGYTDTSGVVTKGTTGANALADLLFSLEDGEKAISYNRVDGVTDIIGLLSADGTSTDESGNTINGWGDADYDTTEGGSAFNKASANATKLSVNDMNDDSPHTISLGAYADEASDAFVGYTLYLVSDSYETKPQEVEMHLPPEYLNYVYPTLLGDTNGELLTSAPISYFGSGLDITARQGLEVLNYGKGSSGQGSLIDAAHNTSNNGLYNLLWMHNVVLNQNNVEVVFDIESALLKQASFTQDNFSGTSTDAVSVSHAVNFSRGTFGDTYVVSALNNNPDFSDAFITNNMGLTKGITPKSVDANITAGSVTTDFLTGSDNFLYTAHQNAFFGGRTFSPWADGEAMDCAGYLATEKIDRYVAQPNLGVGSNTSKFLKKVGSGSNNKVLFVESTDKIINFYPEVAMLAFSYDSAKADIASAEDIKADTLYVMGEFMRQVKPSGIIGVGLNSLGTTKGTTKSDSIAVGTDAKNLSERFGGKQVIYAGGNINLSVNTNVKLDVSGFILDQIDRDEDSEVFDTLTNGNDVKSAWGNKDDGDFSARLACENWVSRVRDSIAVDIGLDLKDGSTVKRSYNGFRASANVTGGNITSTKSYPITVQHGAIVKNSNYSELINAIQTNMGSGTSYADAEAAFNNSGIAQSIAQAIESDAGEGNATKSGLSEAASEGRSSAFGADGWYDEVVRTFVVRYYECTPIEIKNISVSDKLDIKSGPTQSGVLFSNGYLGQWNMTVYLKSAGNGASVYNPQSKNYGADTVLCKQIKIDGADFVVSDATTADAHR